MKVGFGWDIHKLSEGGKLVVGGVVVEEGIRAAAHSDGDVLCHAIMDALIGVALARDIGDIFPEIPENENMNSLLALSKVVKTLERRGFKIINVDCTVVLSRIRLSRFRSEITLNLKEALSCENVSVKFKSGNGVGEVGKGEAIESFAVVLLEEIA